MIGPQRCAVLLMLCMRPAPTVQSDDEAMRHHQRGAMAHAQGDMQGALKAFRQAIEAKPDFAYAYYRLGFILREEEERQRRRKKPKPVEDPIPLFRTAVALDGADEMAYHGLGQALSDRGLFADAAETYRVVASRLNPRSAQAYWALGKVLARTRDEFDSDPEDPEDPSHFYELAAALKPLEFGPDGSRTRRVKPEPSPQVRMRHRTLASRFPLRRAAVWSPQEVQAKRDAAMDDLRTGRRRVRIAGEEPSGGGGEAARIREEL